MYEEKDLPKKKKDIKSKGRFFAKEKKMPKEKNEKVIKVAEEEQQTKDVSTTTSKTEKKVIGLKTDWISIFVKLAVFLLIFFLIIFVVTKIRQAFSGNRFEDNLEKMKEVAYVYYKVESHRPIELNEEVTMTLEDMENGSLIEELKNDKNEVCSKEYSYVSLVKETEENYDLNVYLSCGGKAQNATYDVTFKEENPSVDTPTTEKEKTTLYELKRNVTTHSKYSCPDGYLASGRYCIKPNVTKVLNATPIYQVTPERDTTARYKTSDTEFIYADPILLVDNDNYTCPSGYELNGTRCVKYGNVKTKKETTYTCPNGGTPSGKKCLFTTYTNYTEEKLYCTSGKLVNKKCYVTKSYSVKCITGKKDEARNACYTTYTAEKELTDWLFDGKVTYSESKTLHESDTVSYEVDEYLDNGKVRYNKYIRKYERVCDDDDELKGSTCRHYDSDYEKKYCSGEYSLTSDGTECYTYKDAKTKDIKGTYTCPDGYSKRGSGEKATCVRYENAVKTVNENPYCTSGYDLTSNGQCVKTVAATVKKNEEYVCPTGYTQRGTGKNTVCYKKTTTDAYYYCTNPNATLKGNRCVVPEITQFKGYRCPLGYTNSGSQCIDTNGKDYIYATETSGDSSSEEIIWSKNKDVAGWTWTGAIKEE